MNIRIKSLAVGAAFALASTTHVADAQTVTASSVSPAPFTVFINSDADNRQHLSTVDFMFDGATDIKLTPGVLPVYGYGSPRSNFTATSTSAMYAKIDDSSIEVIDGGVRVHINAGTSALYGDENGVFMSSGTLCSTIKLPAGMLTVDGVPNEEIVVRYMWDKIEKVNPLNITDGCTVTADQLQELVWPEGVASTSANSNYNYQLVQYPNGFGTFVSSPVMPAFTDYVKGFYAFTTDQNGMLHANFAGTTRESNDGELAYSGSVNDLPEGVYYLQCASAQILSVNDENQRSLWTTPVRLVRPVSKNMTLTVAEGTGIGRELPRFVFEGVSGRMIINHNATATATIGGAEYILVSDGNTLGFSADDARNILDTHLNRGTFTVNVSLSQGAVTVLTDEGTYTNFPIDAQFSVTLEENLSAADIVGQYYMQYAKGRHTGGDAFETAGFDISVDIDEDLEMLRIMIVPDETADESDSDTFNAHMAPIYAELDGANRTLTFPSNNVIEYDGKYCIFTHPGFNLENADDPYVAAIDSEGNICLNDWTLIPLDESATSLLAPLFENTSVRLVPLDDTVPAAPAFEAELRLTAGAYQAVAYVDIPDTKVTALYIYDGDECVYTNYEVTPRQHLEIVLDANPALGSVYNFKAVVANCHTLSEAALAPELTYNPIQPEDIENRYYVKHFEGRGFGLNVGSGSIDFRPVIVELPDDYNEAYNTTYRSGIEFDYSGLAVDMYIDGKVKDGKCVVFFQGLPGGWEPAGTLDLFSRTITFDMAASYVMGYTGIDPETGNEAEYTKSFAMINPKLNPLGDAVRNKPATAYIDTDGCITFSPFQLITAGEIYNSVYLDCQCFDAIQYLSAPEPASAAVEATATIADEVRNVHFAITAPTHDASGDALEQGAWHEIYVYRAASQQSMARAVAVEPEAAPEIDGMKCVYAAKSISNGETVTFDDVIDFVSKSEDVPYIIYNYYCGTPVSQPVSEIVKGEKTEAIESIGTDDADTSETYNLRGVRVDASSAAPGIYIVNGKKVIIK